MLHRQRVFSAMYGAIVFQLQAFKVDILSGGSVRRCPDTRTVLTARRARVVHRPTPFERLALDFLVEYGVSVDDVSVAEGETGTRLVDQRLEDYWTAYHAVNAGPALVRKGARTTAARARSKVEATW